MQWFDRVGIDKKEASGRTKNPKTWGGCSVTRFYRGLSEGSSWRTQLWFSMLQSHFCPQATSRGQVHGSRRTTGHNPRFTDTHGNTSSELQIGHRTTSTRLLGIERDDQQASKQFMYFTKQMNGEKGCMVLEIYTWMFKVKFQFLFQFGSVNFGEKTEVWDYFMWH